MTKNYGSRCTDPELEKAQMADITMQPEDLFMKAEEITTMNSEDISQINLDADGDSQFDYY